ncbi:MAG: hypothetical protein AVDCRST_MAG93-9721 [uncultured Chloroflexia bacterium]|uniref:Uncharacterized protein n=1 Tax=uncultured Chloroflexia bacterium TaxID=1672391 RepID=A0A6J4NP19_9CHLR|nr:MAG: hypothetical protein AVDCRST_MAG93-9721 [uncultured Chloroflexia bacterium]
MGSKPVVPDPVTVAPHFALGDDSAIDGDVTGTSTPDTTPFRHTGRLRQ